MLLSVCMIVRDGAYCISRALNSIKELADEIIIIDTGSYDRTKSIVREYGAKVYSYQWNHDFSQVRNYALKQAQGKWVLFLDADEELGNDYHYLRPLLKESEDDGFYLPIINLNFKEEIDLPRLNLRLFQLRKGYNYQGRINEQILDSILKNNEEAKFKVLHLPIIHHQPFYIMNGDKNQELRPINLSYLEISKNINIEDPCFIYLKDSFNYFREGGLTLTLNELERGLVFASEKKKKDFLVNIILILLELKQYKRAEEVIKKGLILFPQISIFYFWQGYLDYQMKRYNSGIKNLKIILEHKSCSPQLKGGIYLLLGLMFKEQKKNDEARLYLEKSFIYRPESKLILSNLIDILTPKKGIGILKYLTLKKVYKQGLAFLLLETYYNRKEYEQALQILDSLSYIKENRDEFLYWRGKILLHLKQYRLAGRVLKQISPSFAKFRDVLDLLWLVNLLIPGQVESKSVINQIKLIGDRLAWNIINLFNEIYFYGKETWFEFKNIVLKLRFYKKCLYYLNFLVEYTDKQKVNIMLEIIKSLKIKTMNGDLGKLFYQQDKWEKAYYYLRRSLKQGEMLNELIWLADTCNKLGKYQERNEICHKINRIAPYS